MRRSSAREFPANLPWLSASPRSRLTPARRHGGALANRCLDGDAHGLDDRLAGHAGEIQRLIDRLLMEVRHMHEARLNGQPFHRDTVHYAVKQPVTEVRSRRIG